MKKISLIIAVGLSILQADLLVDNFLNTTGLNLLGGNWIADSDQWAAIGGTSSNTAVAAGEDLVEGEGCDSGCWAGHNLFKAYDAGMLSSNLKVSAPVPGAAWASAGWVMNFTKEQGAEPWLLQPWEKGNETNLGCFDAIQMDLSFTAGRQLWIDVYNPFIEQAAATNPQFGWRYEGTGAVETKTFTLGTGFGGITSKWIDPAAAPMDLGRITRLRIFYEGQMGLAPVEPAPYDDAQHNVKIGNVILKGSATGLCPAVAIGDIPVTNFGIKVSSLSNKLILGGLKGLEFEFTIRDFSGKVHKQNKNQTGSSIDISDLNQGMYIVTGYSRGRQFSGKFVNQ